MAFLGDVQVDGFSSYGPNRAIQHYIFASSRDRYDFSLFTEDAFFAAIPVVCLLVLVLVLAVSPSKSTGASNHREPRVLIVLGLLVPLHVASVALYCLLPKGSPFRTKAGLPAYAIRAAALLTTFATYLRLPNPLGRILGFYLLITAGLDSVRVHTLWELSLRDHHSPIERVLSAIQIAIVVMAVIYLLYEAAVPRRAAQKGRSFSIDEQHSSTLGTLFFGWLYQLLAFGKKTRMAETDLEEIEYSPNAVHRELQAEPSRKVARDFTIAMALQYSAMVLLKLLGACATLGQPFIIGGVVRFLGSRDDVSVGIWLVIAMCIDQWIITLSDAHAQHLTDQLSARFRSYLIHKIFQRSLSPTAQEGSSESVSAKALVHVTVDTASTVELPSMTIDMLANLFIVVVGSYMLYLQIGLAFLGPLGLALLGTMVPVGMGPFLARTDMWQLEAAEKRVQSMKQLVSDVRNVRIGGLQDLTAEQVADYRDMEIYRATNYRKNLLVVIIMALSMNSWCTLAAFGFFSLKSGVELDYSRLFTSLSILNIMLVPLNSTLQEIPGFVSALVSWKRIRTYLHASTKPAFFVNRNTSSARNQVSAPSFRDEANARYVLRLDNATIGWVEDEPVLREISLTLEPQNVAVYTGGSSSGKSTLLKCVLGEAQVHSGFVDLQAAQVAFCDQVPWFIPEQSLRENIILQKPFSQALYDSVIKVCCLDYDFSRQDMGDAMVIDSKASSLSGGQRARLALARALYREPKLLILDDVFTGLDRSTAAEVADNIFGQGGYTTSRSDMAVLIAATTVPTALIGKARIQLLRLDSTGKAAVIDNPLASVVSGNVDDDSSGKTAKETNKDEEVGDEPSEAGDAPLSSRPDEKEVKDEWEAYREYAKSFGSWTNVTMALVGIAIWAAIGRGSVYWLTRWANAYDERAHVDSGFYVAIYGVFSLSDLLVLAFVTCLWLLRMMPDSSRFVHSTMFATFLRSPASVIEATKSQIINRFTQDVMYIDLGLPLMLINFILGVAMVIASTVMIGIGTPYAVLLLFLMLPPLWLLQKHYLATSSQLRTMQLAAQAPILGALESSLDGRITLRAFDLNDRMMKRMSDRIYTGQRPGYLYNSIQSWFTTSLDMGNIVVTTSVTALLVGLKGGGQIGWGGIALLNAISLSSEIKLIMRNWTTLEVSMASMRRILSYINDSAVEDVNGAEVEPSTEWPSKGLVEMKNLTLAYGTRDIVRNVSLTIPSGTKVAIVGRTGSGKTSLMQCFFGLIRVVSGSIEVDSVDLATVPNQTLRKRLVGNPQQTFSNGMATLRRNLDPSEKYTDDEIRKAVEQVAPEPSMRDDIMSKLDSKWEECNFSIGWQKRIGLARTALRDSSVYLFDEPTSGMDEESHKAIMDCIFTALAEKTVIVITHTVTGIEQFDHVVVMADGQLVESAPPADLLAEAGSQLYRYVHGSSPPEG